MSFRSKLNDYIQKNELPEWLETDKLAALLPERGNAAEPPRAPEKKPITPAAPIARKEVAEPVPQAEVTAVAKPEKAVIPNEINAKTFIDIARAEKLTGGEFLELLGNSRLSNSAYKEIELNPEITLERIVEILEASPLKRDDYVKLIAAINTIVKNRRKAEHLSERMTGDTAQLPEITEKKYNVISDTVSIDVSQEKNRFKPAAKEIIAESAESSAYERVTFVEATPEPPVREIHRVSSVELQRETAPSEISVDVTKPADAAIIRDFASLIDDDKPADKPTAAVPPMRENELTEIIPEPVVSEEKPSEHRDFSVADIAAERTTTIVMPDFADAFGDDEEQDEPETPATASPDTQPTKSAADEQPSDNDFDFPDFSGEPTEESGTADFSEDFPLDTYDKPSAADSGFNFPDISGASDKPKASENEEKNGYVISGVAVKPAENVIKPAHSPRIQPNDTVTLGGYYVPELKSAIAIENSATSPEPTEKATPLFGKKQAAEEIPNLSAELSAAENEQPEPAAVNEHHIPKSSLQKSLEAIISEKKAAENHLAYAATNEPDEPQPKKAAADDMEFSPDFYSPDSPDDGQSGEDNSADELLIAPDDDFFSEKLAPQKPLSVTTILSDLPTATAKMPVDASVTTILSGMSDAIAAAEKQNTASDDKKAPDEEKKTDDAPRKKPKNMIDLPDAPAEKPEREGYKSSEYFEETTPVKRSKTGAVIITIAALLLLLGGAAFASYYFTGSFIPFLNLGGDTSADVAASVTIDSYEQLAGLISTQPAASSVPEYTTYNTESSPYTALLGNISAVGDRVYYANGNTVTQLTAIDGKPVYVAENTFECTKFLGIAALNSQLGVVYEQDGATIVAIYGADFSQAQYTYAQDGAFAGITYTNERLCLTTSYTAPEGATAENAAPSYKINDAKTMLECANIYVPSAPESRSFTVIGTVSESPLVFAVAGGSSSFAKIDGNGICVVTNYTGGAVVRKFDINEHVVSVSAETTVGGNIPAPCFIDERGGKIRLLYTTENGAVLGVYSSALTPAAQADKIASGEQITGVSYSDSLVTVLTDGVMRCFNTDGETIKTLDTAVCTPYTQQLLRFGENLVGLEVVTDDKGVRSGLRVAMYSYENTLKTVSEQVISIIGTDGTDYNEYLNSDVEANPAALTVSEDLKTIVVPIIYFDGVSKVEKFITYKYNVSDGFMQAGEFTLYDENSSFRASIISGGYIYVAVDDTVTGISIDGGKIIASAEMK